MSKVEGVTDVPGPLYGAQYDNKSGAFIISRPQSDRSLKRRISDLEELSIKLTKMIAELDSRVNNMDLELKFIKTNIPENLIYGK
jgi:hypothetical protein